MLRSPRYAAIAGSPRVTNRRGLITVMQMLETASLIGLMRRTHALAGRVGTVAGVLGLFRRDAVLAVGGYDATMATEDIELTWRLLQAGHLTGFAPNALVGMQVPQNLRTLVDLRLDRQLPLACLPLPVYPLAYWTLNACAALTSQARGLIGGPRKKRVVWDIERTDG
ncbi:glycosyltransferase family 2 protein [Streptomyces drozdowiczii]|uniref:Glycosyltransferase n=2 Tax=Streptomyces drozdowiczii TaxID=202862 RepID=A0ABY6PSQ5_9ACTN|nr:glycosyltransferase family 2 protein [Streptomyces drozdowiczii]MCX0245043.1 glycosyltransferase [Streptomyces drozdowiczii]UZK55260.1 glycosyltransferase [Streptomyces drozdowiczii]